MSEGMTMQNSTWDIARLNELISTRTEESLTLEYKGAGALEDKNKREITKDISAMANSDGGTIIYGMAEHTDRLRQHLPERLDPVDRTNFSKEWLEQVASNIHPKIESLRIYPVEIPPNPNHAVYVVEVPKATTAHQAQDLKYYRRHNFQVLAMEDYQIRELMNRQKFPTLTISAILVFFGEGGSLRFEIRNTSEVLVKDYAIIIRTPVSWGKKPFEFSDKDDEPVEINTEDTQLYQATFTNASRGPLFPKCTVFHNFHFKFSVPYQPRATIGEIRYMVYADSMPYIKGTFDPEKIIKSIYEAL